MLHHFLTLRFALVAYAAMSVGCARFRVPAIDPTGNCLFSGQSTEVNVPNPVDCLPKPAYPSVGAPPICPPGNAAAAPCGGKNGSICPAAQLRDKAYVVMMPGRVVAPVGSEVIVVSGICGETGYYVKRQPIEWMLAPDSVGHVMQVSNDKWSFLTDWVSTSSKKLDLDWAKNKTHPHRQTVTRGTENLADDVVVQKGQSWVSIMSPTEGASHVTALAPNEENWDRRRQTSTIYWVDAQWVLPTPQIVRVDRREPAILTTTLARSQNIGPIEGWLVRYELADGPSAVFENGLTSIEVPTDLNGQASARLTPQGGGAGISQVAVQIVRPGTRNGDVPRMVVGQGVTSVTWSAPGLAVRAMGPTTTDAENPVTYRVEVVNTGDVNAPDVVLAYSIPQGTKIISTNPPHQPFGDRLEWRLGDLPARGAPKNLEVTVAMTLHAQYQHCFKATSMSAGQPVPDLAAQGCATTIVNRSALAVQTSGPQTAAVGTQARFMVEIANVSSLPVTNIKLRDTFDAGLQHVSGEPSPIELPATSIGVLQPGERRGIMLTFNVVAAGRHCHRLEITADGGVKSIAEGCVTATSEVPVPRVAIKMSGPPRLNVGESGTYTIEIRNTGTLPLKGLRIGNQYSGSLRPTDATEGRELGNREIYWRWPELAVGEAVAFQMKGLALRADPSATSVATVTTAENLTQTSQVVTQIVGVAGAEPPPDAGGSLPPASGGIAMSIDDTSDPVLIGREFSYVITRKNNSTEPDANLITSIELPEGMALKTILGARDVPAPVAGVVTLPVVRGIRGREELAPIELKVVCDKPGTYKIKVTTRSDREARGVTEIEETRVVQD